MSTRDDTESMNDVLAGSGSNESVNAGMETFVRLLYINQTLSPGEIDRQRAVSTYPGLVCVEREEDCGIEAAFMRTCMR